MSKYFLKKRIYKQQNDTKIFISPSCCLPWNKLYDYFLIALSRSKIS